MRGEVNVNCTGFAGSVRWFLSSAVVRVVVRAGYWKLVTLS